MNGTVYGYPRPQFFERVPVVPGFAPQPPRPAPAPVTAPREDPGFNPVRIALAAVILVDLVLALFVASVWR